MYAKEFSKERRSGYWRFGFNSICSISKLHPAAWATPYLHSLEICLMRADSKVATLCAPCIASPLSPLPIMTCGTAWMFRSCLAYRSEASTASCSSWEDNLSAETASPNWPAICTEPSHNWSQCIGVGTGRTGHVWCTLPLSSGLFT